MQKSARRLSAVLLPALLSLSAANALANTAANTQIVNTASLYYNGNPTPKIAQSTVTVGLVSSFPALLLNGNTAAYQGTNTPILNNSLILTSSANGPAVYHVTAAAVAGTNPTNATGTAVLAAGGGFDITLGASVTTSSAANQSTVTTLVIPTPDPTHVTGSGATLAVNGLGKGSQVSVGGYTTTVNGVSLNVDGTTTLTISAVGAPVAAGIPVFEIKTAPLNSITADPGTVDPAAALASSLISVYSKVTVTTAGVTGTIDSSPALSTWTTVAPTIDLIKYVRNVDTALVPAAPCNTPTNFTVNGTSKPYYTCGMTGVSTNTLEYVVVAFNKSDTVDLTTTKLTDVLPTAYVTFKQGTYGSGNDVFYSADGSGAGLVGFPAAALNANQASLSPWPFQPNATSTTLSVNVGAGANSTSPGTIGKKVGGVPTSLFIAYQAIIK